MAKEESPLWESSRYLYFPPQKKRDNLVHALFCDPEAMLPHCAQLFGMKVDVLEKRRESQRKGAEEKTSFFVDVISKEDLSLVAVSGFRELRKDDINGDTAEWGIIVVPKWRQKGAASEIFASNVDIADRLLNCMRIVAATTNGNHIMQQFLMKRGFLKEENEKNEWVRFEAPLTVIKARMLVYSRV